jgi:hypothetical protein
MPKFACQTTASGFLTNIDARYGPKAPLENRLFCAYDCNGEPAAMPSYKRSTHWAVDATGGDSTNGWRLKLCGKANVLASANRRRIRAYVESTGKA